MGLPVPLPSPPPIGVIPPFMVLSTARFPPLPSPPKAIRGGPKYPTPPPMIYNPPPQPLKSHSLEVEGVGVEMQSCPVAVR